MDIEKVKNYNQKVLALVLSVLLGFGVIGLISLVIFLFTEVFDFTRSSSVSYQSDGIKSTEEVSTNSETDLYKLHVTYNFPELIDTLNQIYLIPVGHKVQSEAEGLLTKRGKFSSAGSYSGENYDYYSQGTYINFLIFDAKNNKSAKLFKQQMLIGQYETHYDKGDVILVFEAADKDSNKDGAINLHDETALFFYSIAGKTLKQAKIAGQTVLQYSYFPKQKNAIIRFGKEPDYRTDKAQEFNPGILCKYDYSNDLFTRINDSQLDKELETLATGKK